MKPGRHRARAIAWELGITPNNTEFIAIKFRIVDGEFSGQTIQAYLYFTDKTAERSLQSLRYCGWQGSDLVQLDGMGTRDCTIDVQPEEYKGKTRLRVKWVNALDDGRVRIKGAMNADERRLFAARFKAMATQTKALPPAEPDGESGNAGNANGPPPPTDEDMPWEGDPSEFDDLPF